MAWLLLFLTGMVEVAFVMALGYSDGFERFWPTVLALNLGGGHVRFQIAEVPKTPAAHLRFRIFR